MVHDALAVAMVCLLTIFVRIPVPATGGYLNPGDVMIVAVALSSGCRRGALAGAVGSALADLLSGAAFYVPASLIAKGGEGWLAGLGRGSSPGRRLLCASCGACWMAGVYFLWEAWFIGIGPAAVEVWSNLWQGGLGVVGGLYLAGVLPGDAAVAGPDSADGKET